MNSIGPVPILPPGPSMPLPVPAQPSQTPVGTSGHKKNKQRPSIGPIRTKRVPGDGAKDKKKFPKRVLHTTPKVSPGSSDAAQSAAKDIGNSSSQSSKKRDSGQIRAGRKEVERRKNQSERVKASRISQTGSPAPSLVISHNGTASPTARGKSSGEKTIGAINNMTGGPVPPIAISDESSLSSAVQKETIAPQPAVDFSSDFVGLDLPGLSRSEDTGHQESLAVTGAAGDFTQYPADDKVFFTNGRNNHLTKLNGLNPFFRDDLSEFRRLATQRWADLDAAVSGIRIRHKPTNLPMYDVKTQAQWDDISKLYEIGTPAERIVLRLTRTPLDPLEPVSTSRHSIENGQAEPTAPGAVPEAASASGPKTERHVQNVPVNPLFSGEVPPIGIEANGAGVRPVGGAKRKRKEDTPEVPTSAIGSPAEPVKSALNARAVTVAQGSADTAPPAKRKRVRTRTVPRDSGGDIAAPDTTLIGSDRSVDTFNSRVESASGSTMVTQPPSTASSLPGKLNLATGIADRFKPMVSSPLVGRIDDPMAGLVPETGPSETEGSLTAEEERAEARIQALIRDLDQARRDKTDIVQRRELAKERQLKEEAVRRELEELRRAQAERDKAEMKAKAKMAAEVAAKKKSEAKAAAKAKSEAEAAAKAKFEAEAKAKANREAEAAIKAKEKAEARAAAKTATALERERRQREAPEVAEAAAREREIAEAMAEAAAVKARFAADLARQEKLVREVAFEQATKDIEAIARERETGLPDPDSLVAPSRENFTEDAGPPAGQGASPPSQSRIRGISNPKPTTPMTLNGTKRAAQRQDRKRSTPKTQIAPASGATATPDRDVANPEPGSVVKVSKESAALAAWRAAHPAAKIVIPTVTPSLLARVESAQRNKAKSSDNVSTLTPPFTSQPSKRGTEGDTIIEHRVAASLDQGPTESTRQRRQTGRRDFADEPVHAAESDSRDDFSSQAISVSGRTAGLAVEQSRINADPLLARLPSSEPEDYSSEDSEPEIQVSKRTRILSPGSSQIVPERGDNDPDDSDAESASLGPTHRSGGATARGGSSDVEDSISEHSAVAAEALPLTSVPSPADDAISVIQSDPDATDAGSWISPIASRAPTPATDIGTLAEPARASRASFADLDGPAPTQPTMSGTDAFFAAIDAEAKEDRDMLDRVEPDSPSRVAPAGSPPLPVIPAEVSPVSEQPVSPSPVGGESRSLVPGSSLDQPGSPKKTPKAKDRMMLKNGSPAPQVAEPPARRGRGRPPLESTIDRNQDPVQVLSTLIRPNAEAEQAVSQDKIIPDSLHSEILSKEPFQTPVDGSAPRPANSPVHADANNIPTINTRDRGPNRSTMNRNPCILCDAVPSHLQKVCPIIIAGLPSIERRMTELRSDRTASHDQALEKLEGWVNRLRNANRSRLLRTTSGGSDSGLIDPDLTTSFTKLAESPLQAAVNGERGSGPDAETSPRHTDPRVSQGGEGGEVMLHAAATPGTVGPLDDVVPMSAISTDSSAEVSKEATEATAVDLVAPEQMDVEMQDQEVFDQETDGAVTEPESDVEMEAPIEQTAAALTPMKDTTVKGPAPTSQARPSITPRSSQMPTHSYNPRSDIPSLSSLRPDVLRKPRLSTASVPGVLVPATQTASPTGSYRLANGRLGAGSVSGSGSESAEESSNSESDSDQDGSSKKSALPAALAGRMAGSKVAGKAKWAKQTVQGW